MGGAVWLVGRSELRRHVGSVMVLAGVVAVVVGAVLALAGGARRTSTVVDRFVAETDARDLTVYRSSAQVTADPSRLDPWRAEIAAIDGVEETGLWRSAFALAGTEVDFSIVASPDGSTGYGVDRLLMREGREPTVDSLDEVALNVAAAEALDAGVGDTITVGALPAEQYEQLVAGEVEFTAIDPIPLELQVVGVGRSGEELSGSAADGSPFAMASPAFYAATADRIGWGAALLSLVTDGTVTAEEVTDVARAGVDPSEEVEVSYTEDEWRGEARDSARVVATALWAFAGVATVAGLLGIAQVVVRQAGLSAPTSQATRALGLRPHQQVVVASFSAAVGVVAGALAAPLLAVAASGAFPVSVARRAEPEPGLRVDAVAVVGGTLVLLALLLLVVAVAGARFLRRDPGRSRRRTTLGARLSSSLERPVPRLGVHMALDDHRGGQGVPIRSALVGAAVGAAGIVGVAVFVTSTAEAIDDPEAYGWVWTSKPDITSADDPVGMVMEVVERDEIEAAGDVRCGQVRIEDLTRQVCALTAIKGSMQLAVADGRIPVGATEVAVGSRVLDDVDAGLGDPVTLTGIDGTEVTATVVGQAVGPMGTVRNAGDALHVSPELMGVLLPVEIVGEFNDRFVGFGYADGVDAPALEAELAEQYPLDFPYYAHAEPPSLLSLLEQMRWLFLAAAVFLAAIGTVGLSHYLVVSVRRRRGELGVLRAMGLRRAQVRRLVSWQAATATGVGVVIGAPLGVVLGRNAWLLTVADQGMAVEPASAWWAVAAVIAGAAAGAAVLGAGPGWLVARRSPAESLRVE